ncbi:uncharacterized protein TRAVEDRAFT_71570 [Trametes versicolor FP-101664 SS1]|uniref:uncharacterized protein n=1 Tax=Trametes versicolor (strain FP-101664) TaxID=717944 RepID=UPI000462193F|nr:uncharacterized protein TRAVEDRAFT_71570 [Trametes versicolor FP-101664 SS1]EIW59532.1 hypothetical protein TRAVEDRAFT_71570 [Trametes versicolor FP-101664 SS1]
MEALKWRITNDSISGDELNDINEFLKSGSQDIMKALNAHRRVNRLPPELLRLIFLQFIRPTDFVCHDSDCASQGAVLDVGWLYAHKRASDVLALSHVCRRWREVILLFPGFWTSIRDVSADETMTFFERARGCPLQVAISGRLPLWLWDITAERGASIRELHCQISTNCHSISKGTGDLNVLALDAPNVERLSLSRGYMNCTNYGDHPNAMVLKGATEHVKMLSIRGLGSWLPPNQFPALTHLVVSDVYGLHAYAFCAFLSRCANLTNINLRNTAVYMRAPPPAQSPANTRLHRLRKISLNARYIDLFHVLQIDRARMTIELTLNEFIVTRARENSHLRSQFVSRKLAIPKGLASRLLAHPDYVRQPLTRLYLRNPPKHNGSGSLALTNDNAGICINSAVPLGSEHACLFTLGEGLDHVTELYIDGVDPDVCHLYTALRPELPNLRTLSVLHADTTKSWALEILIECVRSETNGTAGTPLAAPALRLVIADGVDLGERKATRKTVEKLGGAGVPLPEKKYRLILRAPRFSPEYYTDILPRLQTSWESVETEVRGGGRGYE